MTNLKISDSAAFVFVSKIKQLRDVYRYTCYTVLSNYRVPISEISDEKAVSALKTLYVDSLPLVTRIDAYNRHHLPGHYGLAVSIKIRDTHDDQPTFAVAHYHNAVNQFKVAQKFCDAAIYIKTLDHYCLYYLGARWNDNEQKYSVIRLYIPLQQTMQKLRYHMNIIYQLQRVLSEKEYKDLKNTLKLRFAGDDIEITFYHHLHDEIVTARFDFFNKRHNTCMNVREILEKHSPVDLILSLYYSTKAYYENNTELLESLAKTTDARLR